jgi:hypothetical protein
MTSLHYKIIIYHNIRSHQISSAHQLMGLRIWRLMKVNSFLETLGSILNRGTSCHEIGMLVAT